MRKERWAVEEGFAKGNFNAFDEAEVFDSNILCHIPPFPDFKGLEAFKQFCTGVSFRSNESTRKLRHENSEEGGEVEGFALPLLLLISFLFFC